MHYLIDGHNLIARLPDLSLDDPDDEAKLTLRLKSWVAGGRKRRVTVIFDGGLPGGEAKNISGGGVTVTFASTGQTADSLLITRIQQAKNPAEYTLVSSDQQVIAFAKFRRMPHLTAEAFAVLLGPGPVGLQSPLHLSNQGLHTPSPPHPSNQRLHTEPDPHERPNLSEGEVAEWLDLFGPEPELPPKPPPPTPKTAENPQPPPKRLPPAKAKRSNRKLSPDEVDEWLKLFGADEP